LWVSPHALAVPTGLEPATSGLTGRRELQLHHETKTFVLVIAISAMY
jgi:hypothetical protein